MGKRKKREAGSFDVAAERLDRVRAELELAKVGYEAVVTQLATARVRVRQSAEDLRRCEVRAEKGKEEIDKLRRLEERLRRVVDRGPGPLPTVSRKVENPMRADEQVSHEMQSGTTRTAYVDAQVSLPSLIGGLARLKGLTEAQIAAATRFRRDWELAQLGGARAIDYAQVRVDTSGVGLVDVAEAGEDARRRYKDAVQHLGLVRSSLVERVVCDGFSLRALGRLLGRGVGGRAGRELARDVLDAVDALAEHMREAPATSVRMRSEGTRAAAPDDGVTTYVFVDKGTACAA